MKKLVYPMFLTLALFTLQNASNQFLASPEEAYSGVSKNNAEKIFSIQTAINAAVDGDTIY
ncbi:MAG: hypothetical protein QW796_04740, partial [Thermoproteota archaeon]